MNKNYNFIIFIILLIGTIATILISPDNWIPSILFLIISTIGLIDFKQKKIIKIMIFFIILMLIFIFKKMDIVDSILLFI